MLFPRVRVLSVCQRMFVTITTDTHTETPCMWVGRPHNAIHVAPVYSGYATTTKTISSRSTITACSCYAIGACVNGNKGVGYKK